MKKVTFISIFLVIAFALLSDGCKKEKDKVLNMITISGNIEDMNGEYTPESAYFYDYGLSACEDPLYRSVLRVNFTGNYVMTIYFHSPTHPETIPTGTIALADYCIEGFYGVFDQEVRKKIITPSFSTGTITVSKEGDIHDIDFNLKFNNDFGGGTLKGNFKGELPGGESK